MSAKDISRFLFQPRKRYSSVRMQQGRVILDSDWNESERIDDEEARRTLVDMMCSKGTSNQGFRIDNVRNADVEVPEADPVASFDFDVENGSFYIGGLRFESETDETPETFLEQSDWLQVDASTINLSARPDPVTQPGRHDLVYLRGWEQCVTAVEDSELRERALGGPDTSVRMRRMRRIEVLTDTRDSCAAAFTALQQRLTASAAGSPHEFDPVNSELKSKARLTVVPNPADVTEDPCRPAVPGGYLGADNQTLRVQLTATNRFIWGYDNAAPLYRVQIGNIPDVPQGVDGTRRKVTFLTRPRDQAAQPLAGQAVEIIPWGALLSNQEKVAEFQGELFTVETSFDPEDGSLTISQPLREEWVQWLAGHPQFWSERDEPEHQQYFYLRLWTGGSGNAADPDHQFTAGTPVPLAGTGLSVTFSGEGLVGDFWILAARPSTPDLVVPWELLESAPPAGPRYFFAPLALISWSPGPNNAVEARVRDCRATFHPLCDVRGCCTVTVGDGVSSRGDFDSIEEAIAHLPAAGGEVCLLPGLHRANATLVGRRNVAVKGCSSHTRVIPRPANAEVPIFHVVDSQAIALRDMDLVTLTGTAIVLESTKPGASNDIQIAHNRILAFREAIQVRRCVDVHITENRVRILDKQGAGVAILALMEDSVVERNDLRTVPAERTPPPDQPDDPVDPTDPCADPEIFVVRPGLLDVLIDHVFELFADDVTAAPFKALGGIQIAGGSERVRILDNTIAGGAGNGITLGGVLPAPAVTPDDESDQPQHVINHAQQSILGAVQLGGTGTAGIGVVFAPHAGGEAIQTTSGPGGSFLVDAAPGTYDVSLSSPGLEIEKITTADNFDGGVVHLIGVVRRGAPEPEDALAFLYEIQIDRNQISRMGLSGIGYPIVVTPTPGPLPEPIAVVMKSRAIAALLGRLGSSIRTLGIHRNQIHGCLQNPFEGILRAEAARRGFGGISLGSCDNVTISGNRIERNGASHIVPACGIFIRLGDRVDIRDNHILDNGPFAPNTRGALERGVRGGIVLGASSLVNDEVFPRPGLLFDTGRHTARIHDNIVYQPAGHALRLAGVGPTSICGNRFNSDLSGPERTENLAGVILVQALGISKRVAAGLTLFNSNQSHLGRDAATFASQVIWTTDDIGFDGNQSVALSDGVVLSDTVSVFTNTYLLARTLRATDSRFKEPRGRLPQASKVSLLTRTTALNNTNDNQGDHCIFAFNAPGPPPNVAGNQVVNATACSFLQDIITAPVSGFPVVATADE